MSGFRTGCRRKIILGTAGTMALWFVLGSLTGAGADEPAMRGPRAHSGPAPPIRQTPTSCVTVAFLESIKLYQRWISPVGGDRCGFRPSCSRFGYASIVTQGPLTGLLMTADRLTRCNIWKRPGPDYLLLPSGRLYDPPSNNLLFDQ